MYYEGLEPNVDKEALSREACFTTNRASINGMVFKAGQWLPVTAGNENTKPKSIFEVCDIVVFNGTAVDNIYAVCQSYSVTTAIEKCNVYSVHFASVEDCIFLVKINDYLSKQHYPVNLHKLGPNFCFRSNVFSL